MNSQKEPWSGSGKKGITVQKFPGVAAGDIARKSWELKIEY